MGVSRAAAVTGLLLAPVVLLPGRGGAGPTLAVYNGAVSATAVHVQAGTSAFPNFATGAVDNRYPLAAAHQDSSPFNLAYSSPLDTGPTGQTVAATVQQPQPQYAEVRCPPQCDEQPVVVGSEPGPFASSRANDDKVTATARVAGVGRAVVGVPALDPGRAATLRAALSAWRDRFLTIDDAVRHPMPAADTADGFEGDMARSESRLDGGVLVLTGESAVEWVSVGGGAVVLRNVSVAVVLTNDGTPRRDVTVRIGAAEVGGTPVTIGADGVSVKGQALPGLAGNAEQASAALNEALRRAGIELRVLAPAEQASDHQLTLDAVGVLVHLAPPSPAAGVPTQFTTLAVGEVFADALAVPGQAAGELDGGLPDAVGGGTAVEPPPASRLAGPPGVPVAFGSQGTGAAETTGPRPEPATAPNPRPTSNAAGPLTTASSSAPTRAEGAPTRNPLGTAASAPRLAAGDTPVELLLLYILWQALIIATVASLWVWRRGALR